MSTLLSSKGKDLSGEIQTKFCCTLPYLLRQWQLRIGAPTMWTNRQQALEPALIIVLRLVGVDSEMFGISLKNLLGPKYWMTRHPDDQARFAMAELTMQYVDPESRAAQFPEYKIELEAVRKRVEMWLNDWEKDPTSKIIIMYITHSHWSHGTLQFVPKTRANPEGWSASWKQVGRTRFVKSSSIRSYGAHFF